MRAAGMLFLAALFGGLLAGGYLLGLTQLPSSSLLGYPFLQNI